MKPRITVITVGIDDLERSLRFYRDGLGLPTQGIIGKEFGHGAVAFFDLQADVKLATWPRKSISHDSGIPEGALSPTEFTLGHNVFSREKVDALMGQARNAGTVILPLVLLFNLHGLGWHSACIFLSLSLFICV